jgi:aryl-alcohol dehydrogenase-like predicted oxidoreductase
VPIPGTTTRVHFEENLEALRVVLTAPELARIDAVAPKGATAGLRYPEAGMRTINI